MKVSIRFYAYLAEQFNIKDKFDIELNENSNILQLLEKICEKYDLREKLLDKNNNLRDQIAILKNGREIKFLSGMNTVLENGNEISIFPPVHGG